MTHVCKEKKKKSTNYCTIDPLISISIIQEAKCFYKIQVWLWISKFDVIRCIIFCCRGRGITPVTAADIQTSSFWNHALVSDTHDIFMFTFFMCV